MAKQQKNRSSQALRDALFDELDELRSGNGDPARALAVSRLAQQILSTARVEMEFHRMVLKASKEGESVTMGSMQLGTHSKTAASVGGPATEASSDTANGKTPEARQSSRTQPSQEEQEAA